jgi:hypothetical protein
MPALQRLPNELRHFSPVIYPTHGSDALMALALFLSSSLFLRGPTKADSKSARVPSDFLRVACCPIWHAAGAVSRQPWVTLGRTSSGTAEGVPQWQEQSCEIERQAR